MLEFIADYGMFLAKAVTVVAAVLLIVAGVVAAGQKNKRGDKGSITVTKLNDKYTDTANLLKETVLDEEDLKLAHKEEKKKIKEEKAESKKKAKAKQKSDDPVGPAHDKKRIYVIEFDGDIEATQVESLREEITAVLMLATQEDEVVIKLQSPGGLVHGYGLAASQLSRISSKGIPLTACVDMVAASGGYMMACVADRIIAAPFAVLGSIGVMAAVPNVHRVLKKYDVDYDIFTAGEYKQTVSTMGEITEKGRKKFLEDLEDTHVLFKEFVKENREAVDIDSVATGEVWYGRKALEQNLIDEVLTSDDYLVNLSDSADIFEVKYEIKKPFSEKLGLAAQTAVEKVFLSWWQRLQYGNHYRA